MVISILLIGILLLVVWGIYIGKNVRLAEYTSNRSHGSTRDILFTLLGSLVGGYMFFGLTAIGYEAGTIAFMIGVGYCIGLALLAISVPRIKTLMDIHDCDTMDDFLGAVFGRNVQMLVSITNFIFFLAVVAAQFIALKSYLSVVAPSTSSWLPLVAALVVILYTSFAGYKGVVLTDIPQFVVISLGSIVLVVTLLLSTSLDTINTVSSTHFPPTGYGTVFLVGTLLLFPLTLYSRSDLWQRIAFAETSRKAQRAFYYTIPALLLFYAVFAAIGIVSRAELGTGVSPESSGLARFEQVLSGLTNYSVLPDMLLSLVSLGIFAALLSTADTNLNIGSVALTKFILRSKWLRHNKSIPLDARFNSKITCEEKYLINSIRVISAILGLLALVIALVWSDIVDIMIACASILMVFLPAVVSALFFGHIDPRPALVSIFLGLLSFVLFAVLLSNYKISFIPSGIFSALSYYSIHLFDTRMSRK